MGHGGYFRVPLKIHKAWCKRGFRSTNGPVTKAADIKAGIVFGLDGKGYNLKQIKPARGEDWKGITEGMTGN